MTDRDFESFFALFKWKKKFSGRAHVLVMCCLNFTITVAGNLRTIVVEYGVILVVMVIN